MVVLVGHEGRPSSVYSSFRLSKRVLFARLLEHIASAFGWAPIAQPLLDVSAGDGAHGLARGHPGSAGGLAYLFGCVHARAPPPAESTERNYAFMDALAQEGGRERGLPQGRGRCEKASQKDHREKGRGVTNEQDVPARAASSTQR